MNGLLRLSGPPILFGAVPIFLTGRDRIDHSRARLVRKACAAKCRAPARLPSARNSVDADPDVGRAQGR